MSLSAFDDKLKPPQEDDLAAVLGATFALWNELRSRVLARFAPVIMEKLAVIKMAN